MCCLSESARAHVFDGFSNLHAWPAEDSFRQQSIVTQP
jgi:hypothetical protein